MTTSQVVWAINVGSASLKAAAFRVRGEDAALLSRTSIERASGSRVTADSLDAVSTDYGSRFGPPVALAHRLVHGGPTHFDPVVVGPEVAAELRSAVPFAPLHLPGALEVVDAALALWPDIPSVAVFDTGFHRTMPEVARRLPIPREYAARGYVRYGFHGLSCESVVRALGASLGKRAVIAHLGSGSSVTAVLDGRSIDTSMGLTPTGGVPMETRSGDLDPGVVLRLLRDGLDLAEVERLLTHESGLAGMSGGISDMRELLAKREAHAPSREAVESFVYGLRKTIAGMAAALGGLDALVFTGGIGERAPIIRSEVCAGLGMLGAVVDQRRNDEGESVISADGSDVSIRVVAADEERVMALAAARCVEAK